MPKGFRETGIPWYKSLQARMVVIFFLIILLTMQLVGAYLLYSLESFYVARHEEWLRKLAGNLSGVAGEPLAELTENPTALTPYEDLEKYLLAHSGQDIEVSITDREGTVIISSNTAMPDRRLTAPEVREALSGEGPSNVRTDEAGRRKIHLALPVAGREGRVVGTVYLIGSLERIDATLTGMRTILFSTTLLALAIAAVLSFFLSRTITVPVHNLTARAADLAGGRFDRLIEVVSEDEIGRLAGMFNHLTVRLRETLEEISAEDRMRREFVANVSHELRTPLTTVRTYAETLLEGGADTDAETSARFLRVIMGETDRMARLVEDLMTLSRLDSDRIQLDRHELDVTDVVTEVAERFAERCRRKKIDLRVTAAPDLPPVTADRDRLEQVLTNLLGNAVDFTPEGGTISIGAERVGEKVAVSVRDSGVGIPAEDLPRIFDRFFRVERGRSREFGGTGLGLSIARDLVEAHGGRIAIESETGDGTEVRFTLPVRADDAAVAGNEPA